MENEFGLTLTLYLASAAIMLLVLFFVIRGAILSALAEDRKRKAQATRKPAPVTHLDQDGL